MFTSQPIWNVGFACCSTFITLINRYNHLMGKIQYTTFWLFIFIEEWVNSINVEKATLKWKENSFAEILPCDELSNREFRWTERCKNVSCFSSFVKSCSTMLLVWQFCWSLEYLLLKNEAVTCVSDDMIIKFLPDRRKGHSQLWSGPAGSTAAVFTVTSVATVKSLQRIPLEEIDQEINVDEINTLKNPILTHPVDPTPAWKTIIVLNLDLYSRPNELVNSWSDLRNKYVACLEELHVVFGSLRAIGTFIDCSVVDHAWMNAK